MKMHEEMETFHCSYLLFFINSERFLKHGAISDSYAEILFHWTLFPITG